MLKKSLVVLLAFLAVFVVCWCFAFDVAVSAADVEVAMSLTSNANTGSMTSISFGDTPTSDFSVWYGAMVSAWGNPVGYLSFDTSSALRFSWDFVFTPAGSYDYIIIPRYTVSYGEGNTNSGVTYTSATPAVSAGLWVEVDSRTLENISNGLTTIDYSWVLYQYNYSGTSSGSKVSSITMNCIGDGLGAAFPQSWSFPIFAPKAYTTSQSGDTSGSTSESGSTSVSDSTSGSGSGCDCQQWDVLNQRLDSIELYLNSINWDLSELNDKLWDESYKASEVSAAESKFAEASRDTQSLIDGMSIPVLDYEPSVPDIPGSNSIGTLMDFVGGLWWVSVPLVTACGCWVASLLLYGKHG